MIEPLRLPEFIKRPARAIRDNPLFSLVISSTLRMVVPEGPIKERVVRRTPRIGKASATLPNGKVIRMESTQCESVLNAIFYRGWTGEEPETLPLWYQLSKQAQTAIDVGAHVGHFSLVSALANPSAAVHAFEPLPRILELLRRNVRLSDVNVHVHDLALDREPGEKSFFSMPDQLPSSSSLSAEFAGQFRDIRWEKTKVKVDTLDNVFPALLGPTIIKIDTETTEPDVLAGGRNLLRSAKPAVILEVLPGHGLEDRLHSVIDEFDYSIFAIKRTGLVRYDRIVGSEAWRNYLLSPKDGPMAPIIEPMLP